MPQRQTLPREVPPWVKLGARYFLTLGSNPMSQNQFCLPDISTALFESIDYRQREGIWFMRLVVLMPDHLHALVSMGPGAGARFHDTSVEGLAGEARRPPLAACFL